MEVESDPQAEQSTAPKVDQASKPAEGVENSVDDRAVRRKRIADLEATADAKADPLEANLSATTADFMGIAYEMADALKQALAQGPVSLESVKRIEPALNAYFRVTRQMDRLVQLEMRSAEARQRVDDVQSKLQLLVLQDHLQDAAPEHVPTNHREW